MNSQRRIEAAHLVVRHPDGTTEDYYYCIVEENTPLLESSWRVRLPTAEAMRRFMVAGGERLQDLTIAVLGENGETILELVSIALLLLRDYEGDTFLVGHEASEKDSVGL